MSLLEICQWLQNSTVGTNLRESQFMFPVIETIHVLGLTASVGLILVTDLRLIGAIMKDVSPALIMKQLKPWMLAGFIIMFLSGGMLFWSEAERLYPSWPFRIKLILIFLAGVNALYFEATIGRNSEAWTSVPQ